AFVSVSSHVERSRDISYCYFDQCTEIQFRDSSTPLGMTKLLQPFAVNLINAHVAAYEIPIFLIGETASVRGPGKLARRLWMIRIVNRICFDSRIRRKRLSLINQDRVIDAEAGVSSKKANKHLPTRQSCIQTSVRLPMIPPAWLNNP